MRLGYWGMIFAVAICFAAPIGRAEAEFVLLDDFNRVDSEDLGSGWTTNFPGLGVANQQAYVTPINRGTYPLATYNNATATTVQADVFSNGNNVQYAALVLGYATLSDSIFVKVQNNGTSTNGFDRVAFYYGNNGVDNGGANIAFLALDTPFQSGRIQASLIGNTVTLLIDSGFTGNFTQSYSVVYEDFYLSRLGTGVGIGAYNTATLDNFGIVTSAVPEPGSLAMILIAGLIGVCHVSIRRDPARISMS